MIKIFYDQAELDALDIDETTLKIYYYNTTLGDWQLEPNQGVDTVNDYVWANVTHFSLFGAFGSSPSGGGGGSGGSVGSYIGTKYCTENWTCGPWSACYNTGIQYKTCVDASNCGTELTKPALQQSCTYTGTQTTPSVPGAPEVTPPAGTPTVPPAGQPATPPAGAPTAPAKTPVMTYILTVLGVLVVAYLFVKLVLVRKHK